MCCSGQPYSLKKVCDIPSATLGPGDVEGVRLEGGGHDVKGRPFARNTTKLRRVVEHPETANRRSLMYSKSFVTVGHLGLNDRVHQLIAQMTNGNFRTNGLTSLPNLVG